MQTEPHQPSGLRIDEPIPFEITPKGHAVLRAWRITRLLKIRRARHWRN